MNPIFSRTFKALCAVAFVALLSACGASSTVSPFAPTRVIGLGDGYNDVGSSGTRSFTVTGTNEVATVVEQLAAYFGVGSLPSYVDVGRYVGNPPTGSTRQTMGASGIFSYAVAGSLISGGAGSNSLADQINLALADVGGSFSDTDLIVISAGTWDIVRGNDTNPATINAYASLIELLVAHNAKHVLVMQPLEVAQTPFGYSYATYASPYSPTAADAFFTNAKGILQTYVSAQGFTFNPIIFGVAGLSSDFKTYTSVSPATVGIFTATNGTFTPYCTNWPFPPSNSTPTTLQTAAFVGCGPNPIVPSTNPVTYDTTAYDITLFADGLNLTPAGNRWVAGYLYNATAQGWR
jgi:hypothetical protein